MKAKVYFTREITPEKVVELYHRLGVELPGKVAVKVHSGEKGNQNFLRPEFWKPMVEEVNGTIVECNTAYGDAAGGVRDHTEAHMKLMEEHGWTQHFDVDIMDAEGPDIVWPIPNGKILKENHLGKNILNYDSLFVLTHFKGHSKGGFGGSNKNIGIGCADGRIGKAMIHTTPGSDDMWDISDEEFMERMTESAKAVVDHFGEHISYINVMRNMSVSCDCEGTAAEPVVTPNVGILASLDILAVDQASVDLVYAMKEEEHHALVERIESRHGLRQLTYMKELHMGNDRYHLIDIDNGDQEISPADAVKNLAPFQSAE